MDAKLAYTILEAIEAGAGSRTKVYEAINSGDLKARKRGTRTIILVEDLKAYLEALPDYHEAAASLMAAAPSPADEGAEVPA